jgi:hypothetical protein
LLHLRCGDDILGKLEAAGLPGEKARWCDPFCEGPIRAWPDDGARRAERSAWIASRWDGDEVEALRQAEADDIMLASAARQDEVVLWFEADLFDQSILIYLLDRLSEIAAGKTSLVCIGSHPEVPEFIGLGQLTPEQLGELFPARALVTPAQFGLARTAWEVMQNGDPDAIWALAGTGTPDLQFLADALRRYLAELPSSRTGLSQTETYGLMVFASGAETLRQAFPASQRFESRPWMGDWMFYAAMRLLASGPAPLLRAQARLPRLTDPAFPDTRFEVTEHGRRVLEGREDWFRLAGASRWQGSILLEAPDPAWRWDERLERPVRAV